MASFFIILKVQFPANSLTYSDQEGWVVMKLSRAVSYTYRKHFRKEEKLWSSQWRGGGRSPRVRDGNFQWWGVSQDMSSLTAVVAYSMSWFRESSRGGESKWYQGGRRGLEVFVCGWVVDLQGSLVSCREEGCSDLRVLRDSCGTQSTGRSQEL